MRQLYAEKRAASFILLGARMDERSQAVRDVGVPVVFATVDAGNMGYENASSVCIDDRAATRAMMDRILQQGHTRVAVIGGCRDGEDIFAKRYLGAMDSLRAHGIAYDPDEYVLSRFTLVGAYEGALRFFETHRDVTAVLTMSDMMAIGVIRALRDLGLRVPQDVSVSGFDGVEIARYSLDDSGRYELNGGTNILVIENGAACLLEADCPDHICVSQGKVRYAGQCITCLPNKLTVTVYGTDQGVELVS